MLRIVLASVAVIAVQGAALSTASPGLPVLKSLEPTNGPIGGGYAVTIRGDNFDSSCMLRCVFGTKVLQVITAKFISTKEIQCIAPESEEAAIVQVTASNNDQEYSKDSLIFTYQGPPTLSALSPDFLPVTLGAHGQPTPVLVSGSGFLDTPQLSCKWGSDAAGFKETVVKGKFISSSQISCPAPPSFTIIVLKLTVTNNALEWSCDSKALKYKVNPPKLSSIDVSSSFTSDSKTITVKGHGFLQSDFLKCSFGKKLVKPVFVSHGELVVTSPPADVGPVEFWCTNDGVGKSNPLKFTYLATQPTVLTMAPNATFARGGETVTFSGENFLDLTTLGCRFGVGPQAITVPAHFVSPSKATCVVPSHNSPDGSELYVTGIVRVDLTNDGQHWSNSKQELHYLAMPFQITHLTPSQGSMDGGTRVTLHGTGFYQKDIDWFCSFGEMVSNVRRLSSVALECTAPRTPRPQKVAVELSTNNRDYVSWGLEFEYVESLTSRAPPTDVTQTLVEEERELPGQAAIMPEQPRAVDLDHY